MTETAHEIAELIWDTKCDVGESVVYDAARRWILFADIPAARIRALSLADGARTTWDIVDEAGDHGRRAYVGSFGICRSGRLVVALQHRVVLFDPSNGRMTDLTQPVDEPATNRFNDGKVGPDGAFWVGSMDMAKPRHPTGHLYRVTADGRIERKASGYNVSNGLAWSPDGRTMYHADSMTGAIDAWAFDPRTGDIADRRRFATLSAQEGRPDGAACDRDGDYWSAGVSAGCLNRFAPDGTLRERIPLPIPAPTMPCFAEGAVWITSLRELADEASLAAHPALGGLHRLPTLVEGAPIGLFAD